MTRTALARPTRTDSGKDCARSALRNSLNTTSRPARGAATGRPDLKAPFLGALMPMAMAFASRTPPAVHVRPGRLVYLVPKLRPAFHKPSGESSLLKFHPCATLWQLKHICCSFSDPPPPLPRLIPWGLGSGNRSLRGKIKAARLIFQKL